MSKDLLVAAAMSMLASAEATDLVMKATRKPSAKGPKKPEVNMEGFGKANRERAAWNAAVEAKRMAKKARK